MTRESSLKHSYCLRQIFLELVIRFHLLIFHKHAKLRLSRVQDTEERYESLKNLKKKCLWERKKRVSLIEKQVEWSCIIEEEILRICELRLEQLTMTLMQSMIARMTCLYCSTVFNSRSICLLHHSVIIEAFRRNQFAVAFFRDFCCDLSCDFFASAFLSFLLLKVFDDWNRSCDSCFCDDCDDSWDSNCCDDCDDSWDSSCFRSASVDNQTDFSELSRSHHWSSSLTVSSVHRCSAEVECWNSWARYFILITTLK